MNGDNGVIRIVFTGQERFEPEGFKLVSVRFELLRHVFERVTFFRQLIHQFHIFKLFAKLVDLLAFCSEDVVAL